MMSGHNFKILIVSSFNSTKCGIRIYTESLSHSLSTKGISISRVPIEKSWSLPVKLYRKATEEKPQVIHIQHSFELFKGFGVGEAALLCIILLRLGGYKVIVTMHEAPDLMYIYRAYWKNWLGKGKFEKTMLFIPTLGLSMLKWLFLCVVTFLTSKISNMVIVHTRHSQRGTLRKDAVVIPHGTYEIEKKVNRESFTLLTFGFVHPEKRYDWVFKAIEGLANVHYIIAGTYRTVEGSKYLENLRKIKPDNVIIIEGFLPEKTLKVLIESSDAIILPYTEACSQSESGVLHMALAFLKPVIAPQCGGFKEYTKAIIYFDLKEPIRTLREAIIGLSTGKNKTRKVTKELRRIKEETSWTNVASRHIELYKHIGKIKE